MNSPAAFLLYSHSRHLTPGVRSLALLFSVANFPGVVCSLACVFLAPAFSLIALPGLILYYLYVKMARDEVMRTTALWAWAITLVYNLLLMLGFYSLGESAWITWPMLSLGLAAIALHNLIEMKSTPAAPA